jgi:hypothetical protein
LIVNFTRFLLFAATLWVAQSALAATPALQGRLQRSAGPYHFELVIKSGQVSVYATDHSGAKVPIEGAEGTATIISGKARMDIPLKAVRDNLFQGSGKFKFRPNTMVDVAIAFPGEDSHKAHFMGFREEAVPARMHAMH